MKVRIEKRLRVCIISVLILLLFANISCLFYLLKFPRKIEDKISICRFSQLSDIKYYILLKPNPIYPSLIIADIKDSYISDYVKSIIFKFLYRFDSEKDASMVADYEIMAILQGYSIDNNKLDIIWQKKINLIPKERIKASGKTLMIDKDVSIEYVYYNKFITDFIEKTRVATLTRLNIVMKVDMISKTAGSTIKKEVSPSVMIPINTSFFKIYKDIPPAKNDAIYKTIIRVQKPDPKEILILEISSGVLFVLIAFLFVFSKPVIKDQRKKKFNNFIKRNLNRITIIGETELDLYKKINLLKFEDLIKISDQIQKPIMFVNKLTENDKYLFFTIDKDICYLYEM